MSSSDKEILEPFESLIKMGLVGFDCGSHEKEHCKVIYGKLASMDKVFSPREISNLPSSTNMKEACEKGCKTNEEIIEYCKRISSLALQKAKETGEAQVSDKIGLLACKDKNEECNWDIVYEIVTPKGERLYKREHCY